MSSHILKKIQSEEVIIIGAGLAGLSAALKLKSFGIPFKIYEARDRVREEYFQNAMGGMKTKNQSGAEN